VIFWVLMAVKMPATVFYVGVFSGMWPIILYICTGVSEERASFVLKIEVSYLDCKNRSTGQHCRPQMPVLNESRHSYPYWRSLNHGLLILVTFSICMVFPALSLCSYYSILLSGISCGLCHCKCVTITVFAAYVLFLLLIKLIMWHIWHFLQRCKD
jgi:hypothetical protein